MKNETEQIAVKKKSSKRIYIFAALCIVLLAIFALTIAIYSWESKPDPASEIIIRHAAALQLLRYHDIEKEPDDLTEEDFAKVIQLSLDSILAIDQARGDMYWIDKRQERIFPELKNGELYDIKLLEKFTNLQEFQMVTVKYPEDQIPKWMKILTKVGLFDLNNRFAIDLSPIKNLFALKTLNLFASQISDLTPLQNLVNLEQLFIDGTPVSNLEPLRGLKNLQFLSICKTEVSDLEPIMQLEKLKTLLVINCPNITDEQLEDLRAAHPDIFIKKDYAPYRKNE